MEYYNAVNSNFEFIGLIQQKINDESICHLKYCYKLSVNSTLSIGNARVDFTNFTIGM